jgi:phosphatidylglycerol:prolipoprotein diacylglycerol transferase
MFPRLFTLPAFDLLGREVGPLTLHAYGVLLALAFLAGLWAAGWQARKAGMNPAAIADMAVYVLIAGLVGAKALLLIVEWNHYSRNPGELFSLVQSGGVFYGGLIGALPVAWWYARRHSLSGWQTADVLAPAVVIGQSVGRIGCLAAGCCHGRAAEVPWAISFTNEYANRITGVPLNIPLHPTQVYESLACLAIFLVLIAIAARKKFHGQVALAYVVLYAIARFIIEFYRGDVARGTILDGAISTSQFIAILMVLGAALLGPYAYKKNRLPSAIAPAPAA